MDNPYHSPTKAVAPSAMLSFKWKRIFAWSAFIYIAMMIIGISSGLSLSYWEIYGSTLEEAYDNSRLVRRIIIIGVCALLYWRMAVPVENRLLHVAATFITVEFIDLTTSFFLFNVPADGLMDLWAFGRSLMGASVGLGLASLSPHNTLKSNP